MVALSIHDKLAAGRDAFQAQYEAGHSTLIDSITKRATSAAERLAAARDQFESSLKFLGKRSPATPGEKLEAAKHDFGLPHQKRDGSQSAADRLAAARLQFTTSHKHSPVRSKRDAGQSPADRLAAAKQDFDAHHLKRDATPDSPADRLAVAKHEFEGPHGVLSARQSSPTEGVADMPTSNMEKTVVPLVIGIVLILLFGIVAGIIVYKRRQKNKAAENAQHRRKHLDVEDDGADEDFEMGLPGAGRVQNVGGADGNGNHHPGFGISANHAGGWEDDNGYGKPQQQQMFGERGSGSGSLRKETAVPVVRGLGDDKEFA